MTKTNHTPPGVVQGRSIKCPHCNGTGAKANAGIVIACDRCDGTGRYVLRQAAK